MRACRSALLLTADKFKSSVFVYNCFWVLNFLGAVWWVALARGGNEHFHLGPSGSGRERGVPRGFEPQSLDSEPRRVPTNRYTTGPSDG